MNFVRTIATVAKWKAPASRFALKNAAVPATFTHVFLPERFLASRPFQITSLDHLVLTVKDLDKTVEFYTQVLGMEVTTFRGGRKALSFGDQKINIHEHGKEFEPKADVPTPGSADLCFLSQTSLEDIAAHLENKKIPIIHGPVDKTGAMGSIRSIYIRDPDGNLIEVSNYTNKVHRL